MACVIPVRLTVLATAEVTPKDPFVVRAPLTAVIDRLYVQPTPPSVRDGQSWPVIRSAGVVRRFAANQPTSSSGECQNRASMHIGFRLATGRNYLIALRQKSMYADAPDTASKIAHIGARLIRTALTGNIWIPKGLNNGFEYVAALPGWMI